MPVIEFNGEVIEFPDSMSNEEIEKVLSEQMSPQQMNPQQIANVEGGVVPEGVILPEQQEQLSPIQEDERRFQEQIQPIQNIAQEARESEAKERKDRRELVAVDPKTGAPLEGQGSTFGEKLENYLLTTQVTENPNATATDQMAAASMVPVRLLGAATLQGNVGDEDTKLLKPFIKDLKDWSESREAQNATADQMISALNKSVMEKIQSGEVPREKIAETVALIDKIEESKNSGALTTAMDVIGYSLELGSDPTILRGLFRGAFSVGKQVLGSLGKKTASSLTQKVLDKTTTRLSKYGIRNNKMVSFIDEQPGATVREKLMNIRRRQKGELTTSGRIQDESVEAMFDERTLSNLEKNADNIQAELDKVKEVGADVKQNIKSKKDIRKADARTAEKSAIKQEEIKGLEKTARTEAGAQRAIDDVPQDILPEDVVEQSINKGRLAQGGKNKGFNEAQKLEKATAVSADDQIRLIEEALIAAEGGRTQGVDFASKADRIFGKLGKESSSTDVANVLKSEKVNTKTIDSIKRIMRGDIKELRVAKEEFDTVLAKGGDLTGTAKENASSMKGVLDEVIESSAGANLGKLRKAQQLGGEEKLALNTLHDAMGIKSSKAAITGETINKGKATDAFDEFLNVEAKKFADNGFKPTTEMKEGGKFMEWKKFLGVDVRKEVRNRAKKIAIADEIKVKVKDIAIDTKKAQKSILDAGPSIRAKIDKYATLSTRQVKDGIERRVKEIKQALSKAKTDASLKGNVASDFNKEVQYFAGQGGFSKGTDSFKTFKSKYGSKLADMVEDQAIFSTFNVAPSGKITNVESLSNAFQGIRTAGAGAKTQAFAFGEGVINKVYSKLRPFESRLNSSINKIKASNVKLSKELNKMKKKAIKRGDEDPTKEAFKMLMDKNPLVTADVMASEFKFFDALDFLDKKTILRAAIDTGNEFTNRQKLAAKRLKAKLERQGKLK